jgi:L-ribulose-5-phosphate 3-epimerase
MEKIIMNSNLGFMQGRLSAPIDGKIQAFPPDIWQDEFAIGKKLGFTCMEWIFEVSNIDKNPLYTDIGVEEIKKVKQESGILINSVVADYFMERLLFGENKTVRDNIDMLKVLIIQCHKCGIPIIEIPLVDGSALRSSADKKELVQNMEEPLRLAQELGVKISLETSLPPREFKNLIMKFKPFKVCVNYDMGNSASLGFDPMEELSLLGKYIINVHIKDRLKAGGTVPLGKGATDFKAVFDGLKQSNYSGDFILQAARQDLSVTEDNKEPDETLREYISFMKPYLEALS